MLANVNIIHSKAVQQKQKKNLSDSFFHNLQDSSDFCFIMTEKEKQYFTATEKRCLQELIIKHKLNSTATGGVGNPNVKKMAWGRLTEEFNSIETNTKVRK